VSVNVPRNARDDRDDADNFLIKGKRVPWLLCVLLYISRKCRALFVYKMSLGTSMRLSATVSQLVSQEVPDR